jgi:hypothetical protein
MAYSTSLPPYLVTAAPAGGLISTSTSVTAGGGNIWYYRSADGIATVAGTSYFSNGDALGMNKYDLVFVTNLTSTYFAIGMVTAVTAGAGATVGTLTSSSS